MTTSRGVPRSVKQQDAAVKERKRGYDEATFVESVVILNAGRRVRGRFSHLGSNPGLAEVIGHEVSSAEAARKFCIHEVGKIQEAQQRRLSGAIVYIPEENRALRGWAESIEI